MVIPEPIARAAQDGRVTAVAAWLNEGGDVNDRDELSDTLLILCAATPDTLTASHTDLVRLLKALIHGVRAAGSWKAFCRQDHKEILRLRSLVARGRTRERLATTRAIRFIVRQGDNGIVWNVLSYWRETG